jgi:hypothetical protein
MDKQIYIQDVPSIELGGQTYTPSDNSLIASFRSDITFNSSTDYIEYYVYNANKQIIDSVERLTSFAIYGEDLSINPEKDLESRAYQEGKYYTVYNFLRPVLSSSILEPYYISEISTDRTEIRLASTDIVAGDIVDSTVALKAAIEAAPFQKDFNLDFGANNLIIANNVLLDDTDPNNVTVLIKLYEPLPSQFDIQAKCWGVEKIAESKAYLINIQTTYAVEDGTIKLKGPNVNLQVASELNKTTEYQNTETLGNSNSSALTYQLNSLLAESGIELNIDYSNYSNFVFFSSAQTRLENFYYKLGLIEEYTVSSSYGSTASGYYNSASVSYWDSKINEVITNFDGYEYYLYYESGSTAWPKTNSLPPYTNVGTTSTAGLNWFVSQSAIAQTFDENNKDGLVETIPMYIKEDPANTNYELFVEMVGQHFDSIWVYTQAVTQKYSSDNRVESGLSKDLIGTALKDFGIKLYQNNFTSDNLYNTYLGYTPSGSLLPYTGQELITTYVTASATGSLIPLDNLSSEVYKRLYHNLPYLLKKKGTVEGLNTLITTFGVPDTILRVYEYGGKDKASNTWDQWQNKYTYAFDTEGINYITSSFVLNSNWNADNNRPQAVEFRFKTRGIPTNTGYYSQSLWATNSGSVVTLNYNGADTTSGSYTGSIVSPYSQYGTLTFYPDTASTTTTASIYLPFFNEGWWSVLINKQGTAYTVYAKNNLYQGQNGNTLGFQASAAVDPGTAATWNNATESYFGSSSFGVETFSGSLQELRYYTVALSESSFNDYVMNPGSIEGNYTNAAPQQLAFRAALGGELYTSSVSIHPKVSGEQATTSSFATTSTFYFDIPPTSASLYVETGYVVDGYVEQVLFTPYIPNREITFYDQPAVGIKNAVSDKIRVATTDIYGTVLSGLNTLQQNYVISQSYTRDVNYLEVGFSPQNEINEDINSQIGFFNIGEYIGDPRRISDANYKYPALDQLSTEYFKKYTASYNYNDYLRLIKFFDNSLFKLIKDFIPARTAAATGAIVKQHLLERNRQRPAQVDYTQPEYTGSVTSLARDYQTGSIEVLTGGAGGSVNTLRGITQAWSSSILTKAGIVSGVNSSQYEFFNGQYSGSTLYPQLDYQLNTTPLLNNVSSSRLSTVYEDVDYQTDGLNPVNQSLILSGSAYPATVQDSNYSSGSAWSNVRYAGVKLSSKLYNTYTPGDVSYGQTAVIDSYSNYIGYFDTIESSDPEYPGGGVVNLKYLVHTDGTVIGLTAANQNLNLVENTFKAGLPASATFLGQSYSNTNTTAAVPIVEGGAFYRTIIVKSGSRSGSPGTYADLAIAFQNYPNGYSSGGQDTIYDTIYFATSSLNSRVLQDSGSSPSYTTGWLSMMLRPSSSVAGICTGLSSQDNQISIWNKYQSKYYTAFIPYEETLFPLRTYDYIRFGLTNPANVTASVDYSFSSYALYRIVSSSVGDVNDIASSLTLESVITGSFSADLPHTIGTTPQGFRIFRRVPDETKVTVSPIPAYLQNGILVPSNFNPNVDPVALARKAGLIT